MNLFKNGKSLIIWLCALITMSLMAFDCAAANSYKIGTLEIVQPWTRVTPKGAKTGAAYFKLINHGATPERLLRVETDLTPKAQIHSMIVENGVMKMHHEPKGVVIAPGQSVEFKPGSWHIMLMDLKQPIALGQLVQVTLVFEHAGALKVPFYVEKLGAARPSQQE